MYHIVVFEDTNEVEVTAATWAEDGSCMRPSAAAGWTPDGVRAIFTSNDYREVRWELPEAVKSSDTATDDDSPIKPKRRRISAPSPSRCRPSAPSSSGSLHSAPSPSSHRPSAPSPSSHRPSAPSPSSHRPSAPSPSGHRPSAPSPSSHRPSAPSPSRHRLSAPSPLGHRPSAPSPSSHNPFASSPSGSLHSAPSPSGSLRSAPSPSDSLRSAPSPSDSLHSAPSPSGSLHLPHLHQAPSDLPHLHRAPTILPVFIFLKFSLMASFYFTALLKNILINQEFMMNQIKIIHKEIKGLYTTSSDELLLKLFPLNNRQSVEDMEAELHENPELQEQLSTALALRGGGSLSECVGRIMTALLTHSLSKQINWRGVNGKMGFQHLQIKKLVTVAVRRNQLTSMETDRDIDLAITKWLQNASDRNGGRQERRKRSVQQRGGDC
ncbi:uncharacterized protein LOC106959344 [Poecilia latipinna]|uniref:uncharacterized protein LOC106959344 n=1 Tax=Poecilia latipinna TaxID=48699 RepID=UPI00072EE333|nr:PREDICTED: uncharacterized protein LOC106959344 [Poecilia latipinna]